MIIVLLGYMGVGKTIIGRKLSDELNYPFYDLDEYIVKQEGQSIAEIFQLKGELYFRKKETQYISELKSNSNDMVLALGGGTPCYGNNMALINNDQTTVSFYLKLPIAALAERLYSQRGHRPLIAHLDDKLELIEFIGKHIFERQAFYSMADYSISCQDKSVSGLVREIINKLV